MAEGIINYIWTWEFLMFKAIPTTWQATAEKL